MTPTPPNLPWNSPQPVSLGTRLFLFAVVGFVLVLTVVQIPGFIPALRENGVWVFASLVIVAAMIVLFLRDEYRSYRHNEWEWRRKKIDEETERIRIAAETARQEAAGRAEVARYEAEARIKASERQEVIEKARLLRQIFSDDLERYERLMVASLKAASEAQWSDTGKELATQAKSLFGALQDRVVQGQAASLPWHGVLATQLKELPAEQAAAQ